MLEVLIKSHSSSRCLGNTFENTMRGTLGNLKCSSTGTQEHLKRKRSNWPPSIFSGYCAAGATFLEGAALFVPVHKRKKKKVVGKEKKKRACIRILLIPSQPRPQVRLLLSPWPPASLPRLSSCPVTTICSLAQTSVSPVLRRPRLLTP